MNVPNYLKLRQQSLLPVSPAETLGKRVVQSVPFQLVPHQLAYSDRNRRTALRTHQQL